MNTELMFSSVKGDWETPRDLFDKVNEVFDFNMDVAASKDNTLCENYFDEFEDGLAQDWTKWRVWCNPPYGRGITGKWVKKAHDSVVMRNGFEVNSTSVLLLPARTDTKWFHSYIYNMPKHRVHYRFLKGRLKFGGATNSAPFPSMLVAYGPRAIQILEVRL